MTKINREIASTIIEHHFGKTPKELEQLRSGTANFVYKARVQNDRYIIRISDDEIKLQNFIKEQWAVQKAMEKKVPVPKILEVANEASKYPYMIVEYVPGELATTKIGEVRENIIKEMGKYTAIINTIPTTGYGHVFDWSNNKLSKRESWAEYIEKEMEADRRLAIFEKHKIFDEESMNKLKSALKEISSWDYKPVLNHGDMRLKNIMVDEKGKISAILDWEFCMSAPIQWDLSIALHDLNIDEKDIFLSGYGMSHQEYRNRARGIKVINIMNYADLVENSYTIKDSRHKKQIDILKTRLRGCLDFYSL